MKTILKKVMVFMTAIMPLTACASDNDNVQEASNNTFDGSKTIVVYFSCTNNTKGIAQKISASLSCDTWQITPEEPYTSADLNYNNNESRANKEQNDDSARPAISGTVDLSRYDVVYVGYPIWWGKLPKIMCTFFDAYDLNGKTIIPFCTSGSSGISTSVNEIKEFELDATVVSGRRFESNASQETVNEWVKSVQLITNNVSNMKININVNGRNLTATLADNSSAEAFYDLLKGGAVTVDMHDYSNFEKVGELPVELPRNDEQITTDAGDIILYQGDKITIYYDTNSWNFTRLGKIEGVSKAELKSILGDRNVTATFSLYQSKVAEVKSDRKTGKGSYYINGMMAREDAKGMLIKDGIKTYVK